MDEAISQGDKDFGALIARMRDAGVRLVYFGGYHTEAGLFVRQARAQGLAATMMVNSAMVTSEYWDLAGAAAEGTLMTFGPDPRKLPSAAEVVARFEAEGHEPRGPDPLRLRGGPGLRRGGPAGGLDRPRGAREGAARGRLRDRARPVTFDAKGDDGRYEFQMYRWHDGRYEDICCGPPAAVSGPGHAASAVTGMSAGSRTVKVEPRPGSLSASMSPPISRASRRLIARPRPVPP